MYLSFSSKKLREVCEDAELAMEEFGEDAAERLKHRLADLRAADSIHEVITGNPRFEEIGGVNCFLINISNDFYMKISPSYQSNLSSSTEIQDWSKVYRIKIDGIQKNDC